MVGLRSLPLTCALCPRAMPAAVFRRYCKALNIVPVTAASGAAAAKAAVAAAPNTASSNSDSYSDSNDLGVGSASQPIDSQQQQRGLQRRRARGSAAATKEPYILQSTGGTTNPELPPVLSFKCVKYKYIQVSSCMTALADLEQPSVTPSWDWYCPAEFCL